jgi:hypothetical protein
MEDQTREVDAWERLGVALQALARHADALAALERAAELQVELGNRDAEGRVVARIARIHTMRGTVNEGISRIWPVLGKLTPLGSSPSLSAL